MRLITQIAFLAASLLFLAACGDDDDGDGVALNPGGDVLAFEKDGSTLTSITIEENTSVQARLVIKGKPKKSDTYAFEVESDNHGLIPPENITITGIGKFRDVEITPVTNQSGVANLTGRATSEELGVFIETELKVIVEKTNIAPVANAGSDQTVYGGTSVTLDGNASSDNDGIVSEYSWLQVAGTNVALATPSKSTTSFIAPNLSYQEVLTFQLTVTDDDLKTHQDTVDINVKPIFVKRPLNDTGMNWGSNYPSGNNASCTGESIQEQDCSFGRDFTDNDDSDGHAGFSFTKIDSEGNDLPPEALSWDCVRDNISGVIWEVKKTENGLHKATDTFNWYNTNSETNGGGSGYENDDGDICYGYNELDSTSFCNTQAFVDRVNLEGLCGFHDWRLPDKLDLANLIDYSRSAPSIDIEYFPNMSDGSSGFKYWTATPSSQNDADNNFDFSTFVNFDQGEITVDIRHKNYYVVLVRSN